MLARSSKRSRYYTFTCKACDLIVAIRCIKPAVHIHKPLRPLYSKSHCPVCQSALLEEQEILREDYQRIEQNWDLLVSGNLTANLAEIAHEIDDGVGEIDISML